ncbi:MAG TPA: hypothetical protein PLM20_06385 [Syntrophomonadaceae bacterium]|nr:hypothetical protein [Syntrophomonadaceae bacterium]HQE23512.1 hypothetical protein [Syntrophomonadaceae bacterium]
MKDKSALLTPEIDDVLLHADWDLLREKVMQDREIVRYLMRRAYVKDGLLFWRAVEGIGVAAETIDAHRPGYATELVRRYLWLLNDESGGTAWNASEIIGSIMAHCPKQCGHFHWQLARLIEDDSLSQGALWGLARLALVSPEDVYPVAELVLPVLESPDPELRGRAVLLKALMPDWDDLVTQPSEDKEFDDSVEIELYFHDRLQKYAITELYHPQFLYK